ncbi:MAG: phage tail tip lysozyme [Oscillospiraceae bacterium]|nr:phage tail tip lysozyme [Oscillospiraceae bacterium]
MSYLRSKVVAQAKAWLGYKESDVTYKEIIDVYNSHKPLARGYTMKYTDAWCATFVSAVAIKCGYTDIMPTECGCEKMIDLYQALGSWKEDDSYVPNTGDVIFYDWEDSGSGDNTGHADHVGIVEKVSGSTITVIEGNYSNSVKRRTLQVNGKYIRGFGLPKYTDSTTTTTTTDSTTKKTAATTTAKPGTIWNHLLGKIGNAYGVAGLMGNLYAESALLSVNLQNTGNTKLGMTDTEYTEAVDGGSYSNFVKDGYGYGLAQWTYYTRKQALLDYAEEQNASIGNLEMQLDYIYKELSKSTYKTVLSKLKNATSVKEASDIVLTKYEKPADQSDAVKTKRATYGQAYYDKYAGTSSSGTSTTTDTSTVIEKKATESAKSYDKSLAGTYVVTGNLNMRNGAGTGKSILTVLQKGAKVQNYGYYTMLNSVRWFSVQVTVDNVKYTGFCCGTYLRKQ